MLWRFQRGKSCHEQAKDSSLTHWQTFQNQQTAKAGEDSGIWITKFIHKFVEGLPWWSSGLCKLLIGWDLCLIFVCLFVCLFFLWWARMSEVEILSADDWVCVFVLFVVLDEVSCTGCYWWLGDARSCIPVVSFVWVLSIWYPASVGSLIV